MTRVTTIGVDLAKKVIQVHGVDAHGKIVVARQLRRKQVLGFFGRCRRAWSAWRPAAARTIGRASCGSSATA